MSGSHEKPAVFFVFREEAVCFVHALLNALDFSQKGRTARIVMEGPAVSLIGSLEKRESQFHALYLKAKNAGLIDGACMACSRQFGVEDEIVKSGLPLLSDMNGHPGILPYIERGFEVLIF